MLREAEALAHGGRDLDAAPEARGQRRPQGAHVPVELQRAERRRLLDAGPVPQLLQQCVAGGRRGPARRVHEVSRREMRSCSWRARVRGAARRRAEVVDAAQGLVERLGAGPAVRRDSVGVAEREARARADVAAARDRPRDGLGERRRRQCRPSLLERVAERLSRRAPAPQRRDGLQ